VSVFSTHKSAKPTTFFSPLSKISKLNKTDTERKNPQTQRYRSLGERKKVSFRFCGTKSGIDKWIQTSKPTNKDCQHLVERVRYQKGQYSALTISICIQNICVRVLVSWKEDCMTLWWNRWVGDTGLVSASPVTFLCDPCQSLSLLHCPSYSDVNHHTAEIALLRVFIVCPGELTPLSGGASRHNNLKNYCQS